MLDRDDRILLYLAWVQDGGVELTQHVLDLPPHGQEDKDQPVNNQDRPEDGQVEDFAPAAQEAEHDCSGGRVPELELGQSTHKRLELVRGLCGQRGRRAAFFHVGVGLKRGIEFGGDEGQEKI